MKRQTFGRWELFFIWWWVGTFLSKAKTDFKFSTKSSTVSTTLITKSSSTWTTMSKIWLKRCWKLIKTNVFLPKNVLRINGSSRMTNRLYHHSSETFWIGWAKPNAQISLKVQPWWCFSRATTKSFTKSFMRNSKRWIKKAMEWSTPKS